MNVVKAGSAFLSLGTSGVYFVSTDSYRYNAKEGVHSFCHAIPKHWHHMAVHLSAACCLDWWAKVANLKIDEAVKKVNLKTESSLYFLPYLAGERTPHNDAHARGSFIGMNQATKTSDMTKAVLEGVVFAFMSGQKAMQNAGVKINDISVVGGGARFPIWGKMLASALNHPLIYRENREVGGAYGAALLAWVAEHGKSSINELEAPPVESIVKPIPELRDYFEARYETFDQIYRQLKPVFRKLTNTK
jgi:xylulokinase